MGVDERDPTAAGETWKTISQAEPGPPLRLRDGLAVLAVLLGAQLAGGFGVALSVGFVAALLGADTADPAVLREVHAVAMPAGIAGGTVASALALALYGWRSLRGPRRAERRRAVGVVAVPGWTLGVAALLGLAIALAYVGGVQLFWTPEPIQNPGPMTKMGTTQGWPQWTWALVGLAFSPWIEEFVFRGQLLGALEAAWGRALAAVVSTALFLALHASEFAGFPPGAIGITAMALGALALRYRTGSVWPAMWLHFGYNALLASGVLLASSLAR